MSKSRERKRESEREREWVDEGGTESNMSMRAAAESRRKGGRAGASGSSSGGLGRAAAGCTPAVPARCNRNAPALEEQLWLNLSSAVALSTPRRGQRHCVEETELT